MAERILIVLWAVTLSFFCLYALGSTHILSSIIPSHLIGVSVDVLFVIFAILFAIVLMKLIPRHLSSRTKFLAFLPLVIFAGWLISIL